MLQLEDTNERVLNALDEDHGFADPEDTQGEPGMSCEGSTVGTLNGPSENGVQVAGEPVEFDSQISKEEKGNISTGTSTEPGRNRASYFRSYRQRKKRAGQEMEESLEENIARLRGENVELEKRCEILQAEKDFLAFKLEEMKMRKNKEEAQERLETLKEEERLMPVN